MIGAVTENYGKPLKSPGRTRNKKNFFVTNNSGVYLTYRTKIKDFNMFSIENSGFSYTKNTNFLLITGADAPGNGPIFIRL